MNYGTDAVFPLRINCNHTGDPLIFSTIQYFGYVCENLQVLIQKHDDDDQQGPIS